MLRKSTLSAVLIGTALATVAIVPIRRSTVSTSGTKTLHHDVPALQDERATAPEEKAPAKAAAAPYSLPFSMAPTKEQFENECIEIDNNHDANNDYNHWIYNSYFEAPLYWAQGAAGNADDWLVFPAISITDASKIYNVSIDARGTTTDEGSYESMEVRIGTRPTVEALSQVVLSEPVIGYSAGNYMTYTSSFGVSQPGTYYVAVRCTSGEHGWRLLVKNLKVSETSTSALYPATVENLTAEADETGELELNVSFNMPTKAANGSLLPADQQLTAKVFTTRAQAEVKGKPGEAQNVKIPGLNGMNAVTVVVSNAEGSSPAATTTVLCGLDYPMPPVVTSRVSDDNYTVILTWDPVTEGETGGVIVPENIVYDIANYNSENQEWVTIAKDLTECRFEASVPQGTPLSYVDLAVQSRNGRGPCLDAAIVSEVIGQPYSLPIDETLEGQSLHYDGLSIDKPDSRYDATFASGDPANLSEQFANQKRGALMGYSENASGSRGHVTLPKFSTKGASNAQIYLPFYLFDNSPAIKVYARTNNGEPIDIAIVDRNAYTGWGTMLYDLPVELLDKECVNLCLDIIFANNTQVFLMEGYAVKEGVNHDLAVSAIQISPAVVVPGEKTVVTATVLNNGAHPEAVPALTGKVTSGGKEVGTLQFSPASEDDIAIRTSRTYTAEFTLNSAEFIGRQLSFTATLSADDEYAANNTLTVETEVADVEQPVITDLRGVYNESDGSIALSWTAPIESEAIETFEYFPAFSYDSKLGRWTNLDFDGGAPYTFGDLEDVSVPDDDKAKAFQVISVSQSNLSKYGITGYSDSDHVLLAMSPQEATADDWFISPEVEADSEVSFMWMNVSREFPETIEIWYSSTDSEVDSFKLLEKQTSQEQDWHEFSVILPSDARYFAIHYASEDAFGIMIDDIIYYPLKSAYELTGYEVLRDGAHLADLAKDAKTYVDTTAEHGKNYLYHIVPNFDTDNGAIKGLHSNGLYIIAAGIDGVTAESADIYAVKGAIVINGHAGEVLPLFNAQGQLLRNIKPAASQHTEPLAPGLYIVGNAKVIVK